MSDQIKASCPHCHAELSIDAIYAGQVITCPHCSGQLTAPAVQSPVTLQGGQQVSPLPAMNLPNIAPQPVQQPKKKNGCLIALAVVGALGILTIGGCFFAVSSSAKKEKAKTQAELKSLGSATPSSLRPDGKIKEQFALFSDFTDVQRENAAAEFTGKIVEWQLSVYDVDRRGDIYRIQTSSGVNIGTFIDLHPRSDDERPFIEALKTGDTITVRGILKRVTLFRNIEIEPAILIR